MLIANINMNMPRPSVHYPKYFEKLPHLSGKTVVVTGASKGLGYITALSAAKKGASVILLSRKSRRADQVLIDITEAAASGARPPMFFECDLLDFSSVRKAAQNVKCSVAGRGIDVLCNNAGVMLQPDQASKDGYDVTMSTNIISHFLLTRELMPELEKAASMRGESRIINMSSGSGLGPPPLNPVFFEKKGGNLGGQEKSYERYHQSKLANLVFTSALHDRLKERKSQIKALACAPGVCATDMFVHACTVMRGQPPALDSVPSVEDGSLAQLKCL